MIVGKSVNRVDAYDKATGIAKYTADLCDNNAYVAKVLHSTIAHGFVEEIDKKEAEAMEGVIKIVTCFDVPDIEFPTAGHPHSLDPNHQDIADRKLLNTHVRYYGDDIAAVIAVDEVTAKKALKKIKVKYKELPFVTRAKDALKEDAALIHPDNDDYESSLNGNKYKENGEHKNILAHTSINKGDFEKAIQEEGLIKVEGHYKTPIVSHCHIENNSIFAKEEFGKITVVASTQLPHIVRRVIAQALGIDWGKVRVIKPYIGGGFGNKQDALYEPLCAYLSTQVGGRTVKLEPTREETFVSNRTRHPIEYDITSYVRKDGTIVARKFLAITPNGGYASHGHSISAKGLGAFPQQYPCENIKADAYTVYTNTPVCGAMRGYGIPQAMWAGECHIDDIARKLGMDPYEYRMKFIMPKGFVDPFSKNENYFDSFRQTLEKGKEEFNYYEKKEKYKNQTGNIRRGVGLASFWYNTAVWPISQEASSCRMILNQDGSIQVQLAETEIGQGADTAFSQMAADAVGVKFEDIHVVSVQDTDVLPFGTGAYASRQTYIAGFAITKTANILREKILKHAYRLTRMSPDNLDIIDGNIIRKQDNRILMSLGDLAMKALYSMDHSEHITAEATHQIMSNAYSFGCTFAEVEVDIQMCKIKVLKMLNVHDCGKLINPQLARAQAHGGMSMALGFALNEEYLIDDKTGRVLNGNLLDYKLLTSADQPDLDVIFIENPEPTSVFGTKSLGEPPTCSGAPAIRNAVLNATGVALNQAPMSSRNIFVPFKESGLFEEVK
ncbi:MAG: xanthine dehydrogenase molybdenum-binding subunit XdhA [Tissierellia bacterium]|nr:xanthine dehydrogenase molybdenum-binding subunit XdhA [Tissierellia bacterium]